MAAFADQSWKIRGVFWCATFPGAAAWRRDRVLPKN